MNRYDILTLTHARRKAALSAADQLEPGEWCGCGEVSCGFHRALDAMRDGPSKTPVKPE